MKQMSQEELERTETVSLISSDRVEGTDVYNVADEHLGHIKKLMIDKRSGRVAYAVMSFGGFLGIGEEYHPLPWETLSYDPTRDGYVVSLTKEQLEGAPRYERDREPDWRDGAYGRDVHDYYGLAPYPWLI